MINNTMYINHSGANINITTGQNCMNNFIFNHTAPINLNFYKDKDGNQHPFSPKEGKIEQNEAQAHEVKQ